MAETDIRLDYTAPSCKHVEIRVRQVLLTSDPYDIQQNPNDISSEDVHDISDSWN